MDDDLEGVFKNRLCVLIFDRTRTCIELEDRYHQSLHGACARSKVQSGNLGMCLSLVWGGQVYTDSLRIQMKSGVDTVSMPRDFTGHTALTRE